MSLWNNATNMALILTFTLTSLPLHVKRLHDLGLDGWSTKYSNYRGQESFTLLILAGEKNSNKYAPPPKPGINFKSLFGVLI
ncbi:MAG TPA: DUF805 domain-containing protein [Methylomirabilota bacterium]|nr:DUF805 domain-containing protein [Methylomirabilota bacterium]